MDVYAARNPIWFFTDSYQATANLDSPHPTSKSRKTAETREDGSTHVNNQRIMDVDSFYGTIMQLDGK